MAFVLDEPTDTASVLRALEENAPNITPKNIRAALLKAAAELEALKTCAGECAEALELAATLKAGQMDSQSRHDEVAKQVRLTLVDVAAKLRA